ncbi:hypothetical protein [Sporosarcina koreensis]|uniref:hypothetical protein n=1 Tax=Sporosarcina koreensis TaxID=334735 RepID=UPI0005909FDE|nr:hypothetical protein [Sporosarcina koreensis]
MSRKQKAVLGVSLAGNVLLLAFLIVGYLKMSLVHEELFYSEVQYKLVELEGLIEQQKQEEWPAPNLVTAQLGDVLNGIEAATASGNYSGWLSDAERSMMERLGAALYRYPHDELYTFSTVTEEDTKNFEVLQTQLQQAGLGMNQTIEDDWKSYTAKIEELLERLQDK